MANLDEHLNRKWLPNEVQSLLDSLDYEYCKDSHFIPESYAPGEALRKGKISCIDGALIAISLLRERTLMLLKRPTSVHAIVPFRQNGYIGAVSKGAKPGHSRRPKYEVIDSLVLSYGYVMYTKIKVSNPCACLLERLQDRNFREVDTAFALPIKLTDWARWFWYVHRDNALYRHQLV